MCIDRGDNHFYYVHRISFDELFSTSDNILVTTACAGRVLGKADDYIRHKQMISAVGKGKYIFSTKFFQCCPRRYDSI